MFGLQFKLLVISLLFIHLIDKKYLNFSFEGLLAHMTSLCAFGNLTKSD
jgi:hypothetical protein